MTTGSDLTFITVFASYLLFIEPSLAKTIEQTEVSTPDNFGSSNKDFKVYSLLNRITSKVFHETGKNGKWTLIVSGAATLLLLAATTDWLLSSRGKKRSFYQQLQTLMTRLGERFSSALSLYSGSGFNSESHLLKLHSDDYKKALKLGGYPGGLANDGNTCFMNSVLESLASSHEIIDFLTKFTDSSGDNESQKSGFFRKKQVKAPFSDALLDLLNKLNGRHGKRTHTYRTKRLLSSMKDGPTKSMFLGYNQEDAQEFYQSLMKQVEKEFKKIEKQKAGIVSEEDSESSEADKRSRSKMPRESFEERTAGMTMGLENLGALGEVYVPAIQVDPDVAGVDSKVYPLNFITPVDGLVCERIGCTNCGETGGIRYTVTSGLGLTLPYNSDTAYRLEDLMDEWKKPETIDGVECNRCGLQNMRHGLEKKLAEFQEEDPDTSANRLIELTKKRIAEIDETLAKPIINDDDYNRLHTKNMEKKSTKIKQVYYSRPPAVLCIHVNRSVFDPRTYMVRKNNAKLLFPIRLNITDYVATPEDINMDARMPFRKRDISPESSESTEKSEIEEVLEEEKDAEKEAEKDAESSEKESSDDPRLEYTLKSVISHFGTHNYGHYIAFRRCRQTWWRISDEIVRLSSEKEVLASQGTFMLFYELTSRNKEEEDEELVADETDSEDADTNDSSSSVSSFSSDSNLHSDADSHLIVSTDTSPDSVDEEAQKQFINSQANL